MPKPINASIFYSKQIQTLEKLKQTQDMIQRFKQKIAERMINKQQDIKIDIPKQLKQKCMALLNPYLKSVYKCEHCNKEFNDGRQLGGHVSKAHKDLKAKLREAMKDKNMDVEGVQIAPIFVKEGGLKRQYLQQ